MLDYLKSFSEALINRTKEVEQSVEKLVYDTKTVDVKLHNSFNRFLMLSNTQFVEQVRPTPGFAFSFGCRWHGVVVF